MGAVARASAGSTPADVDGDAVRRRGSARRRRSAQPRTRVAGAVVRRLPAHGRSTRSWRMAFDAILVIVARARPRVPRGGLVARRGCSSRLRRAARCSPATRSSAARAASPRAARAGVAGTTVPKFRPGGLLIVHAGGGAGLFSTIIAGWANGAAGSQPVTRDRRERAREGAARSDVGARARRASARPLGPAASTAHGRAARHQQGARRRVPRPPRRAPASSAACAVRRFAKPTFTKPAPIDLRHEIATQCDVVIEALAD